MFAVEGLREIELMLTLNAIESIDSMEPTTEELRRAITLIDEDISDEEQSFLDVCQAKKTQNLSSKSSFYTSSYQSVRKFKSLLRKTEKNSDLSFDDLKIFRQKKKNLRKIILKRT